MAAPNPYVDSGPWGHVYIGGFRVPGVISSIDGAERPEEWDVQMPTKKGGASTVWKGTGIASSIRIATSLHNRDSVDNYTRLRDLLRPPKSTDAPPALPIVSPIINFTGITRVAYRSMSPPDWQPNGGYWKGVITLVDFSPPKPVKTGVARPKIVRRTITEERIDPNQDKKDRFAELAEQVKRVNRCRSEGGRIRNGGSGV